MLKRDTIITFLACLMLFDFVTLEARVVAIWLNPITDLASTRGLLVESVCITDLDLPMVYGH